MNTSITESWLRVESRLEAHALRRDGWFATVDEGRLDQNREPPAERTPFDPRPEER